MKKIILTLWATLFVGAGLATANDTAGALLPTGEIRFEKQDGVVLKHEALLLSDTVTVDYLFENITDSPVETTVFFPIPTVGPVNVSFGTEPHDFKFRVWSDGKEIKPELSRKVTLDGTDVTKYFNLMGIDIYYKPIDAAPDDCEKTFENIVAPLRNLPLEEQKNLEELGLLAKGCLGYKEETIDPCRQAVSDYNISYFSKGKYYTVNDKGYRDILKKDPQRERQLAYIDWDNSRMSPKEQILAHYPQCKDKILAKEKLLTRQVCKNNPDIYHLGPGPCYSADEHYKQEVMYYWKQTFPPHQTVHIRHEYKPSFFTNSIGAPSSIAVSEAIEKSDGKPKDTCWEDASYIITTANNWKTPIGQFNLLIFGEKGAAVAAEKSSYARLSPKNYLLETRQDFVPAEEIEFELCGNTSVVPQLYRIDGPANVRVKPNGKKISILKDGQYVWAYPADKKDWFVVLLDEETTGYTHRTNLIPFGK
ncbi:MAG: DUF4424 family protein [Elusimicrobiaceae bacterium]|nr:DUF4424 family protein [Elusimicrobiaceae bacterium]